MKGKAIEQFYNCYKHNLYQIKYIEKSIFSDSYNYQKWEANLQEKSQILRELYEANEKMLNSALRTVGEVEDMLDDEAVTAWLQHVMYFVYEDHSDYEVTVKVLSILEKYIETKAQDWQKIKYYYIRGLMQSKGMTVDYEYPWYEKMQEVCRDWTLADRNSSKERILDAYIHRAICLIRNKPNNAEQYLEYLDEAKREWCRKETLSVIEEIYGKDKNPELYVNLRIELIDFLRVLVVSKENVESLSGERVDSLYSYLETEYQKGKESKKLNGRIFLAFNQIRLYTGKINVREYVKELDLFEQPTPYMYPDDMNFSMRREDLFSCLEQNRLFCNSLTYALMICIEKIKYNPRRWKSIFKEIEQYICGFVSMENGMDIDRLLIEVMKTMSKHMKEEDMFRLLETIMIHRQLPTAIHLSMVSKLVEMLITYIVNNRPEMVIGVLGTCSEQEVQEKKKEIIEFTVKAGLCHDIGKLYCSDIINLQSRKITNEEFDAIKQHPVEGAKIVSRIEAFSLYADIILGHHMYSDRTRGYPENTEIAHPEYNVLVELITICDSLDAATDILGRNYTKGKTFRNTVTELQMQRGTRYSKELVDILSDSDELMSQMEKLTGEDRATVYMDLYVRRVKSLANHKKQVEKYFKPYSAWDKQSVLEFLKNEKLPDSDVDCFDLEIFKVKYVIKNNAKEIIGIFLGDEISISGKTGIITKLILVKESARHLGLGKKLLEYAETKLRDKGYDFVAMDKQVELSDMERFMWINGYESDESGMLMKLFNGKGE